MAEAEEVIAVEAQLPFPLEQCAVHRQRGQCYTVTCLIYGWGGQLGKTATLHKLIYRHYLRFPKLDITKCIPLDRIEANHPKFYASLDARRAQHACKKRYVAGVDAGAHSAHDLWWQEK